MKKCIHIIAVLFAVGLLAAPLCAQITGTITGVAKDKDGKPISGATVELVNTQVDLRSTLVTLYTPTPMSRVRSGMKVKMG